MARTLLRKSLLAFPLLYCLLFFSTASAQLKVGAVTVSPSSCPNNGSIAVNATTTNPPLLYSITTGPIVQPIQTNPVFNSLPPGNYTVRISDGAGNATTATATISGTYLSPDFNVTKIKPYCVGDSNGTLTGNITPGTGLAPYTWQTISPSTKIFSPQSSNAFNGLPAGNYNVRLTDACGSFRSLSITMEDPSTKFGFYGLNIGDQGSIVSEKVGCDSMMVKYSLWLPNPRMPLSFKYNTSNGVFIPGSGTTIDSNMLHSTGMVYVTQIIPGLTYESTIQAIIYNSCGDSAVSYPLNTHPFVFYPKYTFNMCGSIVTPSLENTPYFDYHTAIMSPADYTFTDLSSNEVVQSGTVRAPGNYGVVGMTNPVTSGGSYNFSITDGCGQTFSTNFTIPALAPPAILDAQIISGACIDSVVGTYRIQTVGFGNNAKLVLLSGPADLGSTKPEFAYSDRYSYPDSVPSFGDYFMMTNLAAGTYQYKIIDDCGNEIFNSFTITEQDVTSLTRHESYVKGCPGRNKIYYAMTNGGEVTIKDLSSNNTLVVRNFYASTTSAYSNHDSLLNLSSGFYEITYRFLQDNFGKKINQTDIPCWIIKDTIEIEPYLPPEMATSNSMLCNSEIYVELIPDSTKGVPLYQYEIIAGPELFPAQSSNVFAVSQPGTYTARIYDACGNASAKQITVDTISFDPIETLAGCNSRNLSFPTSLYSVYNWLMPNGETFTGDSLILNPVTPADTGNYRISKITNINGCIDTLHTAYRVTLPNHLEQIIPFCPGTTVTVGPNTYTLPGIYHDTIRTLTGCDSIVVTTMNIFPQHADTTVLTICQGDSIQVAGQYHSIPGFYVDSVQNETGCFHLMVTDLSVQNNTYIVNATICPGTIYMQGNSIYGTSGIYSDTMTSVSGCDSILKLNLSVLPYIQRTITRTICPNGSFNFRGQILTTAGSYRDTLHTAHCDSIVTLNLSVLPYKYNTINEVICQGTHFSVGGNNYNLPGTYRDTLSTNSCDSIVTLNLTVLPYKYNTISYNLCVGEVLTIGTNTYTTSGIYADTLPTANCDSILTITLSIQALKHHDIYETICEGDNYAFNGVHYIHPGIYSDTLPTAKCDSVVSLHLTVVPDPNVQIISTAYETGNGIFVQLNTLSSNHPLDYWWTSSAILNAYDIKNPSTSITNPTWVYVTVTDTNGCTGTDEYQIQIPLTSTLYIPNSFTPNGDESNQIFRVYGTNIAEFRILIFDRWGEIIYESADIYAGWDGTYKGTIVQDGTYVYKVYALGMDSIVYDKAGHIAVLK